MTKYEVIFKDIRKKIENGTFPVNAKLPTEPELGDQYKVSRITVKKAIDQLVAEGLVIKRRGAGTFVKGLSEQEGRLSPQINGLFNAIDKSKIKSEVILFEIISQEVAGKLNILADDFVYHIIRYRYGDPNWHTLDFCYMPILLIPGLKKNTFTALSMNISKKLSVSGFRALTALSTPKGRISMTGLT